MSKSIIQKNENECFVCGCCRGLERHHVIYGTSGRKLSEQYGLTVSLCYEHHRGRHGVHGMDGKELSNQLHIVAQTAFEGLYGHDEWMRIFGRNYL